MIISKTPFRISLFGGGTDYPEWFEKENGQVISFAINKYCNVIVRYLPPYFHYNYRIRFFEEQTTKKIKNIINPVAKESLNYLKFNNHKIEIIHQGDLPGLSGLGGSSSFTVGILNALNKLKNKNLNNKELAKEAIKIERNIIGDKVGFQDQIIASYGGFRSIKFFKNKTFKVETIKINQKLSRQLEKNLIIVYTGIQRFSKKITTTLSKEIIKDKVNTQLNEIAQSTKEAEKLFKSNSLDLKLLAELINFQWDRKKKLATGIINDHIEDIYKKGLLSGALGGKLLGAGGGGFLLFIVPDSNLKKFKKSFKQFMFFQIKIDHDGSKIIYHSK